MFSTRRALIRCGGSKSITLPAFWLKQAGLYDSSSVNITITDDLSLVVRPIRADSGDRIE